MDRFLNPIRRLSRSRAMREEGGQVIAFMAISLVAVIAMAAFVVDVSRFYLAHRQLQASSDAVATAVASQLPDVKAGTTTLAAVEANATTYGAAAGKKNAGSSDLTGVTLTFTPKCYRQWERAELVHGQRAERDRDHASGDREHCVREGSRDQLGFDLDQVDGEHGRREAQAGSRHDRHRPHRIDEHLVLGRWQQAHLREEWRRLFPRRHGPGLR